MKKPTFKSRENDHILYCYESPSTGVKVNQEYWISRSVANVAFIFVKINEEFYVLVTKRSSTMMDSPNLYCAPCGYLNWDENGYDSMLRETYEETGFYLPDWEKYIIFDNNKQPFYVQTHPTENRQNVSHLYIIVLELDDIKKITFNETRDNEAFEILWMEMSKFENNNLRWAFNHDIRIKQALAFYKNRK